MAESATEVIDKSGPISEEEEEYQPFQFTLADDHDRITRRLYDLDYIRCIQLAERRIALHLALRYFKDANQSLGSVVSSLGPTDIVLLNGSDEMNYVHLLFTANLLPHVSVRPSEFDRVQLSPSQFLIITDEVSLSQESLTKISNFVANGGQLLSFNKAISVIASAFPDIVSFRHGETTKDKIINLEVAETPDRNIFLGLANANQNNKAMRFTGTRRFGIVEPNAVEVLVKEVEPTPDPCPLAIKITKFEGTVLHFSPVGTDETIQIKSKDRARDYLKQVEGLEHISETTKVAWKTAFSCSQFESFFIAISLLPLLDIIFGILRQYKR